MSLSSESWKEIGNYQINSVTSDTRIKVERRLVEGLEDDLDQYNQQHIRDILHKATIEIHSICYRKMK